MKTKRGYIIPSLFTLLNFGFGFMAVLEVLKGNLSIAAWFIILAILFDGMDGKLARWTGCETPFGLELDSFSDLISAGVAPAVLVFRTVFMAHAWVGAFACTAFVFAGAYRLARFNALQKGNRAQGYQGVPLPVAGMTIAGMVIFSPPFDFEPSMTVWLILVLFLSIFMMSTVPYQWPRLDFQPGAKRWRSILYSAGIVCLAVCPQWSLAPLFMAYMLTGIGRRGLDIIRGDARLKELFILNESLNGSR
ncbi:MAG TPA: CDP-diacylglycerol--serine O-phosphatidyltransferase [bacterium]|nr:CDP-diacylglycerol--serine O-phosphatidyltransferase [bacterium]